MWFSILVSALALTPSVFSLSLIKRTCTYSVTAAAGDTCESIATDWGITDAQFYSYNPQVGANCASGIVVGDDYCVEWDNGALPTTSSSSYTFKTTSTFTSSTASGPTPEQTGIIPTCDAYYKVVSGDSCQKIVDNYGTFTLSDFYSWNPAIGSDCSSLYLGYYVCVGVPGTPTSRPTSSASATPTGPSPEQTGIISTCTSFYKVVSGDTCQKITDNYGTFTLANFYSWNPAVGSDCSGLLLGYYVCVGVPGTPTTKSITSSTSTGPSPEQTGIISTCKSYYKVVSGDTCQKIVDHYGTFTLANFYSWNPAVGSDCSGLLLGYYVCVGDPSTPTGIATTTTTPSKTTSVSTGPSPEQTGITSSCKSYYLVESGDTCQAIVDTYKSFTLAQFYSWNPAVHSDCSLLFVGYYVCIGI